MALTTYLMMFSLIAITSGFQFGQFFLAGFPGWPKSDKAFPGFGTPMSLSRVAAPPAIPSPPAMPDIPKFPSFPFYSGQFPAFPIMPFPRLPSMQDIANAVPPKGGTYNGIVFSTQSEAKRNEDGTIVKKGGSTILINNDGKVTVEKTGDAPPELVASPRPVKEAESTEKPE